MLRDITNYNALNGTKIRVILSYGEDNNPTGKIVFTNKKCDVDTTFGQLPLPEGRSLSEGI